MAVGLHSAGGRWVLAPGPGLPRGRVAAVLKVEGGVSGTSRTEQRRVTDER